MSISFSDDGHNMLIASGALESCCCFAILVTPAKLHRFNWAVAVMYSSVLAQIHA